MPATDSVQEAFKSAIDKDVSTGIAAIQALMLVLKQSGAKTLQELVQLLVEATEQLKQEDCSVIALTSASELFRRFITLAHTQLENEEFDMCLGIMLSRGTHFLAKLESASEKISRHFEPFVPDGGHILVHGKSKVVSAALTHAARSGKEFRVFLTKSGEQSQKLLRAANIEVTIIEDMAIGYIMNKVDFVVLGAEGVCESGGIVNQLGSLPTAVLANQANKPVYILAESFKFVRFYPLGQDDLPQEYLYPASQLEEAKTSWVQPRVDYTPPSLLSLLFTDLGILTPSAVSDELIKLYL